jgi:hypothetical protein
MRRSLEEKGHVWHDGGSVDGTECESSEHMLVATCQADIRIQVFQVVDHAHFTG